MGDSSGCALAVSALLVLKQSGERMPAALAFITPLLDLAGRGETFLTRVKKDPIHAGDYDVFLSDASRFREKMECAGREVKLKVWKKMWHVFHMQAAIVPESRVALTELCSFVKAKLQNPNQHRIHYPPCC